ncbi:MAG: acetate uptake transporter [Jatrophihabitans sp.]|uniref:acetate uptake transporter n=1 Tax=Jatrophihabitans sp. TaxID=1932789 RepID=UPI003F819B63
MTTIRGTQQDEVVSTPTTTGAGFADPGPLGLAGFAGTTFFLSVINTNMLGASVQTVVLGLALFYGGIAQLLAGMWEFAKGNTFGAVAFTSYGAFWLSFWYLLEHLPTAAKPNDLFHGVGLYLLVWTIFTAYMTVVASRTSGAILAVFALLTLTFLALTIGWFAYSAKDFAANSSGWIHLGGWLGLVTAAAAWYASLAGVMNATAKRVVFPTFPR